MLHSRLCFHVVWTTRDRCPLLDQRAAEFLDRYLRVVARQEHARVLALGIVKTHVHVLLSTATTTYLPRLMQRLKGGSSVLINREGHTEGHVPVRWEKGYAVHTVSWRAMRAVRAYVESQPQRHPDERI